MLTVGDLNVEIGAKLDKLDRGLNEMNRKLKGTNQQVKQSTGAFDGLGAAVMGAFSVGAIVGFSREIIRVRGEFERFEAVLTNSLGSSSSAQLAMAEIQKFASETPFSVRELTDSFVRLTNQGFRPTMQEMAKLGDLAASTGRTFQQLAEAILDAQTGEFERLKEFGIKANAQGEKIIFTFKGVKTEVEKNASAIQEYLLGLGEMEGVMGSTAAIAETLEGKVSNLGDAWDQLLNTIGKSSVWMGTVEMLTRIVGDIQILFDTIGSDNLSIWDKFGVIIGNNTAQMKAHAVQLKEAADRTEELKRKAFNFMDSMKEMFPVKEKDIKATKEQIEAAKELAAAYELGIRTLRELKEEAAAVGGGEFSGSWKDPLNLKEGDIDLRGMKDVFSEDAELGEAESSSLKWMKEFEAQQKKINAQLDAGVSLATDFGIGIVDAFIDAAFAGEDFFETLEKAIVQLLKDFAKLIARSIILRAIFGAMTGGAGALIPFGGGGKIPGLASGGIVTGPTLAMIGEGNESEAVLPLSKLRGMMGGGNGMMSARIVGAGEDLLVYLEKYGNRRNNFA